MSESRYNLGLKPIASSMNAYIKSQLFDKPPLEFNYSGKKVFAGTKRDGKPYYLDVQEGIRIMIIGMTGCMPKGTLVKTINGLKPIEKVDKVLSYNFKEDKIEEKQAIVSFSGKKKIYKIHTKKGVIECSGEHKWFVLRNGKVIILRTNELQCTDMLIEKCELKKNIEKDWRWDIKIRTVKEQMKLTNERGIFKHVGSKGKSNGSYNGLSLVKIYKIEETEKCEDMYDLEIEDNHNFILGNNIITHNSGKTFLLRGLCDRLNQAEKKVAIVFMTDPKDEMKCLDLEEKVLTNNGIKSIKELTSDDKLYGFNYKTKRIATCKFNKSSIKEEDVYEVKLETGEKILATAEHRFFTVGGQIKNVKDLLVGEKIFKLYKCEGCSKLFYNIVNRRYCSRKCWTMSDKTRVNNSNYNNKWSKKQKEVSRQWSLLWHKKHTHPKGMLGKHHSKKAREKRIIGEHLGFCQS